MTGRTGITVMGGVNADYYCRVGAFPEPGETVVAEELAVRYGGKGANQAVAAARMGASVRLLARVGNDAMGRGYAEHLVANGVDATGVKAADGFVTGTAFITLDAGGENTIVAAEGANRSWRVEELEEYAGVIAESGVLLLQGEVPLEVNLRAIEIANAAGTLVMFNPSPWPNQFPWGERRVDILVVNEHEAGIFFAMPITSLEDLRTCADRAAARQVGAMMVTRGSGSTLALSGSEVIEVPVRRVNPVDTVGAGDTFAGVLAAGILEAQAGKLGAEDVVWRANLAAALAIMKAGAQEGMPTLDELKEAMDAGEVVGLPVAPAQA